MIKYLIILLLAGGGFIYAQSINEQIEAIKSADADERVRRMNSLKAQIAKMNEQERFEALQNLQKNMNSSKGNFDAALKSKRMGDKGAFMQHSNMKNKMPLGKQKGKH